jgi:hypothetical protein
MTDAPSEDNPGDKPLGLPLNDQLGLLACPMCGGDAALNKVTYSSKTIREQHWGQDTFHGVNCIVCGLDNKGLVGHRTKEAAAAAWNKRVDQKA